MMQQTLENLRIFCGSPSDPDVLQIILTQIYTPALYRTDKNELLFPTLL